VVFVFVARAHASLFVFSVDVLIKFLRKVMGNEVGVLLLIDSPSKFEISIPI
jgi:hypothetical protein